MSSLDMTVLHEDPSLLCFHSAPAFWKYPHRWLGGISRIDDFNALRVEIVFTHMPVCVCETEMVGRCLVGRNVGVYVCDRQDGLSSRMKNQQ